jgi:hypothetical protein
MTKPKSIEDQITALLAEAKPLRSVPTDDPLADKLGRIVDQINALRAIQANEKPRWTPAVVEGEDPTVVAGRK